MTKWFLAIAFVVTGCGSDCDKLKKKLCAGQDDATCKAMKAWFDSELTDPDGKKLDSDAAELGCKMIMDDDKVMTLYKERALDEVKSKK